MWQWEFVFCLMHVFVRHGKTYIHFLYAKLICILHEMTYTNTCIVHTCRKYMQGWPTCTCIEFLSLLFWAPIVSYTICNLRVSFFFSHLQFEGLVSYKRFLIKQMSASSHSGWDSCTKYGWRSLIFSSNFIIFQITYIENE